MRQCFLTCLLILRCISVPTHLRLREAEKWDIAQDISGAGWHDKLESHEDVVKIANAWAKRELAGEKILSEDALLTRESRYGQGRLPTASIITGVQWPDMPCKDCVSQRANVVGWAWDFKFNKESSLIGMSHFGCLQYWHAMSPSTFKEQAHGKHKLIFSNGQVAAQIIVELVYLFSQVLTKIKQSPTEAEFILGRILHTVADSYAPGHTIRMPDETNEFFVGKIFQFQGYEAQQKRIHGRFDHFDMISHYNDIVAREKVAQICAVKYEDERFCDLYASAIGSSTTILKLYHLAKRNPEEAAQKFKEAVEAIFAVEETSKKRAAGGSMSGEMAKLKEKGGGGKQYADKDKQPCITFKNLYERSELVDMICSTGYMTVIWPIPTVDELVVETSLGPPQIISEEYAWVCNPFEVGPQIEIPALDQILHQGDLPRD